MAEVFLKDPPSRVDSRRSPARLCRASGRPRPWGCAPKARGGSAPSEGSIKVDAFRIRRRTGGDRRARAARGGSAIELLLLLIVGCGSGPELPPPGAEGGILHLWRDGSTLPAVITARRVRQQSGDVTLLRFFGVEATVPMPAGELRIASRAGTYNAVAMDQGGEPVLITRADGPIRIGGLEHGAPLAGRAEAGAIASERSALILEELDLIYRGRRYRVGRLRIDELFAQRSLVAFDGADGVQVAPAPPVWCAALAAVASE